MAFSAPWLREQVRKCRDAYDATIARRRRLYVWLRANPRLWRTESVRAKLGRLNFEWLEGLVEYGNAHDWLREAAEIHKRANGGR